MDSVCQKNRGSNLPNYIAAFTKYLIMLGSSSAQYYDLAKPLNHYKDFWSAAEAENPYPRIHNSLPPLSFALSISKFHSKCNFSTRIEGKSSCRN